MNMNETIEVEGKSRTIISQITHAMIRGGKFSSTDVFRYDNNDGKFTNDYYLYNMRDDIKYIFDNNAIYCPDEEAIVLNTQNKNICRKLFSEMIKRRDENIQYTKENGGIPPDF